MANFPLSKMNNEGTLLQGHSSFYSDEYADSMCDLHLRSEIHEDEHGDLHKYYRLRACHPHTIEMALRYDIRCPECFSGMLKLVGRCRNSHELGLYVCPSCEKRRKA